MRLVERCPACGEARRAMLSAARAFPCDTPGFPPHPDYAVARCEACALIYKTATPDPDSLAAYYRALDCAPFEAGLDFPTDAAALAAARRAGPGARVLDHGCSAGRLLAALGPAFARFGVEPNAAAAARAAARGVTILDEAAAGAERFEVILLTDVYEHLIAPLETTARLAGLLEPGGRLVLVTGLADALPPRREAEHWYFRIYGHLQMAGAAHLDWLAKRLGLEREDAKRRSHYRRDRSRWWRQRAQAFAYARFRDAPSALPTRLLGAVPLLRRARLWSNLPATDQFEDHVVATFRAPERHTA